jgi:hypothetical protein
MRLLIFSSASLALLAVAKYQSAYACASAISLLVSFPFLSVKKDLFLSVWSADMVFLMNDKGFSCSTSFVRSFAGLFTASSLGFRLFSLTRFSRIE